MNGSRIPNANPIGWPVDIRRSWIVKGNLKPDSVLIGSVFIGKKKKTLSDLYTVFRSFSKSYRACDSISCHRKPLHEGGRGYPESPNGESRITTERNWHMVFS